MKLEFDEYQVKMCMTQRGPEFPEHELGGMARNMSAMATALSRMSDGTRPPSAMRSKMARRVGSALRLLCHICAKYDLSLGTIAEAEHYEMSRAEKAQMDVYG